MTLVEYSVVAAASLFLTFIAPPAYAYDWMIVARVQVIESSYIPAILNFKVDATGGACASGQWVFWTPTVSFVDAAARNTNMTSTLSLLMTALATGKSVTLFGNNAGCTINFIYLNNS